jgi:hypothetical protein
MKRYIGHQQFDHTIIQLYVITVENLSKNKYEIHKPFIEF